MRSRYRLRFEQLEDRLVPSTFVVSDPEDTAQQTPGTDDPTDTNSLISLRSAIAAADVDAANGISDTISFDSTLAGATIALTLGQLELSGTDSATITIDGSSLATPVTISGGDSSRVFLVDSGPQVVFTTFDITDGEVSADYGGGIENEGSLTALGVGFSSNLAENGGAIANFGASLDLMGCTFSSNLAAAFGGAISNDAPLALSNCNFENNSTATSGGAIGNYGVGTVNAVDSTFTGNSAGFGGAVVNNSGPSDFTSCSFSGNIATSNGGAIDVYLSSMSLDDCTLTSNQATDGGGVEIYQGTLTVNDGEFEDNVATLGGGIDDYQGSMTASETDFSSNTASYGGGVEDNDGPSSFSGCTFLLNSAITNGGGLDDYESTVTANACSWSGNTADNGDGILVNGGTLNVTSSSTTLGDALLVTDGTLSVSGANASFTANGSTSVSESNLSVMSGGTLSLPNLTSYVSLGAFSAEGANSVLDVSALATVTQPTSSPGYWDVSAFAGGLVNLSGLTSLNGTPNVSSDGTSAPDTFTDTGGSTILDPNLSTLVAVNVTVDGTDTQVASQWTSLTDGSLTVTGGSYSLTALTDVDGSSLVADGGSLTLPGVTGYALADGVTTEAEGATSAIDFPALTTLTGSGTGYLEAFDGASMDMPVLSAIDISTGSLSIEADGSGSQINLPALTSVSGDVSLAITDSADIVATTQASMVELSQPSVASGSAISVTLQIEDADGDDLDFSGLNAAFSLGGTSGGQGTFGAVTDNGDGTYTASFTGSVAGDNTITATVDGTPITSPSSITVTAGPFDPGTSILKLSLPSVQVGGVSTISLEARDAAGNTNPTGIQQVQFAIAGSAFGNIGSVTDIGNGIYTASFTGTSDGSNAITGTINGESVPASVFVDVAGDAVSTAKSKVTLSSSKVASGGEITITMQAKDSKGVDEPAGGLIVAFALSSTKGGQGTFGPVIDQDNGTYTATFTGTLAGGNSIIATIDGQKLKSAKPSLKVTPGVIDPARTTVSVSSTSVKAGSSVTLTLQPEDADGNKVNESGLPVTFTLGTGSAVGTISAVHYHSNGTYTATFTATTVGTNSIAATIDGQAVTSPKPLITVVPGTASTKTSVVTLSSESVAVGGAITIMLQAEDADGNDETTGGLKIAFKLGSKSGGQGTFNPVTDNGNGTYTVTFTGTVAGANTITATIAGATVKTAAPTITVT